MDPSAIILELRRLPQCIALQQFPSGASSPGRFVDVTFNTLNGVVVAVQRETSGFVKEKVQLSLVISCPPPSFGGAGANQVAEVDPEGAEKLLRSWTAQAVSAGLMG